MRKGFTIIEVLIVVTAVGMLAAFVAPVLSDEVGRRDASLYAARAVDAIREAQSSVMSGKNNAKYGVHFEQGNFVLFQGASYVPADTNNVVHALSGRVAITAVALSPGGACTVATGAGNCDVHFTDARGVPVESGTVTITDDGGQVRTVTLNAAGMVEWN